MISSGLDFKEFDGYTEEWVDFIIENRTGFPQEVKDLVYGPIADDKVGRQLRLFNDHDISKAELVERLKYFKGITFQYYFGTEQALMFLKSDGQII